MSGLNLQDDTLIIPAGDSVIRSVYGDYIYNLDSEADLKISIGSERPIQFKQGLGYKLPSGVDFQQVRIINETASDVQCTISYGEGEILDQRFNASGNLRVINAPTTVLKTDDEDAQVILAAVQAAVEGTLKVEDDASQTILSAIQTAVEGTIKVDDDASQTILSAIQAAVEGTLKVEDETGNLRLGAIRNAVEGTLKTDDDEAQVILNRIEDDIEAIKATLEDDQAQRAPLNTLSGATYATAENQTVTLATAAANTGGVIVRWSQYVSYNDSGAGLYVDGKAMFPQTGVGSVGGIIQNLLIPAGNKVELISDATDRVAAAWYEVL